MFIPNTRGDLITRVGFNKFAEPIWGPRVLVPCAVVTLKPELAKTPIRADSSASKATSEEQTIAAKILLGPGFKPNVGDRFEIDGYTLRCVMVMIRREAISGKIDHYECDFEAWPALM